MKWSALTEVFFCLIIRNVFKKHTSRDQSKINGNILHKSRSIAVKYIHRLSNRKSISACIISQGQTFLTPCFLSPYIFISLYSVTSGLWKIWNSSFTIFILYLREYLLKYRMCFKKLWRYKNFWTSLLYIKKKLV